MQDDSRICSGDIRCEQTGSFQMGEWADPSTTNLMALAKLFNMTPEDLLKEAQ